MQMKCAIMKTKIHTFLRLLLSSSVNLGPYARFLQTSIVLYIDGTYLKKGIPIRPVYSNRFK